MVLLQHQDWDHDYVETFVSILSSEIISQLPNGLRMHLSDLYLVELYQSAGASVETDSFLLLLEPFFTLLSSEYDKTIFKRVRELVFLPMLSEYKFGVQPAKSKKDADESGETDGDDEEEEDKVFEQVDLAQVQHRIFNIASAEYVLFIPLRFAACLLTRFVPCFCSLAVTRPSATVVDSTTCTASFSR